MRDTVSIGFANQIPLEFHEIELILDRLRQILDNLYRREWSTDQLVLGKELVGPFQTVIIGEIVDGKPATPTNRGVVLCLFRLKKRGGQVGHPVEVKCTL